MEEDVEIPELDWIVEQVKNSQNGRVLSVNAVCLQLEVNQAMAMVTFNGTCYVLMLANRKEQWEPTKYMAARNLGLVAKETAYRIEYNEGEETGFRL